MATASPTTRRTSDDSVQSAVLAELHWTPSLDAAAIGVSVQDGVVTLTGEVDTYMHLLAANHAAFRVRGVTAVASELTIHIDGSKEHTDAQVAGAVRDALQANGQVPADLVRALVADGVVTLSGTVTWDYQRRAAEAAVSAVDGVRRIDNLIELRPRPSAADAAEHIHRALVRDALLEADSIEVSVRGTTATLRGSVRSAAEKTEAGLATWASPHVTAVHNLLQIIPK